MTLLRGALGAFVMAIALVVCSARPAHATTITFTLDCAVVPPTACNPAGPFGTVTLTDDTTNSNWVDVSVNLNTETVSKLFLNFGPAITPGYKFAASDPNSIVNTSPNGQVPASGYTVAFDIKITDNDNPATNPYSTILKLQQGASDWDINAIDFDVRDAAGNLFALVNHSGPGGQIGASTDASPVPEPATLGLLSLGLLGLRARKRADRV